MSKKIGLAKLAKTLSLTSEEYAKSSRVNDACCTKNSFMSNLSSTIPSVSLSPPNPSSSENDADDGATTNCFPDGAEDKQSAFCQAGQDFGFEAANVNVKKDEPPKDRNPWDDPSSAVGNEGDDDELSDFSLSSDNGDWQRAEKVVNIGANSKSYKENKSNKVIRKGSKSSFSSSVKRNVLQVPKPVSRSRSLSRLPELISQVQDLVIVPTKSGENAEISPSSWCSPDDVDNESSVREISEEDAEKQSQWESDEGDDDDDLPLRMSVSLGNLTDYGVGGASPLSNVRSSDAKHRGNYLFGGMGSLLGPTELDRYFPERNVVIFIATWNMNGKEPPHSLDDFLLPENMEHLPDMYVIGTQESGGDRNEWEIYPWCAAAARCSGRVPEEGYHSLRPGTYFKTKGAVAISFQFFGTKMLFVNTHLFAHEENLSQRVQNYKNIVYNLDLPRNLKALNMINRSKDVTHRFDIVFWLGDLNFRLVGPRDEMIDKIKQFWKRKLSFSDLLHFDQLTQVRKKGQAFQGFDEAAINFAPTFKFDVGTNRYDTSSKQRVPSYTDRILFKSVRDPIKSFYYSSCLLFKTSDHKPVCGIYQFKARPGKDDVPLAAGQFKRDVYLAALKRRRRFFHQASSKNNCQVQ